MKELWLFTTRFPFGLREAFLENEIPVLSERYERVVIFPEHREEPLRRMPANVEVRRLAADPYARASVSAIVARWRTTFKLLRSLWNDAPSARVLMRQWPVLRSRIAQLVYRAGLLEQEWEKAANKNNITLYAYWTHDWVTVLGLVRERRPELTFFSRAHGFDVFEEQNPGRWIPFRSFQLEHVSRVYCASNTGLEHLRKRHPSKTDRFALSRLGTKDHGSGPLPEEGPLHVVSCSFLIPRKRVARLVEALALVEGPVRWTHFGGGEETDLVRGMAERLLPHVQVDLRGMTPNARIMEWYSRTPVDVFVHLSRLEGGVVVAVQEAMSFGIPVVAADSGGVRDIMSPDTGVLLNNEPTAQEVAAILQGWRSGPMAAKAFRDGVREAWRARFDASVVFERFVENVQRRNV